VSVRHDLSSRSLLSIVAVAAAIWLLLAQVWPIAEDADTR
jgi:hypothetical protein